MSAPQSPTVEQDIEYLNRRWYERTGREPLTPRETEQERAA